MATETPSSPTPPHPPAVEDTHPDAAVADLPPKTDLDALPSPEAAGVTEREVAETQEEPKSEQAAPEVKEEEDKEKGEERKLSPAITEAAEEDNKGKSELETTPAVDDKKTFINPAVSFKEESYFVSDLSESERRALDEFKKLVQEAIDTNTLSPPPQQPPPTTEPEPSTTIESALKQDQDQAQAQQPASVEEPTQVSIWGIPLLKDERTDVILLKFLRARDFNVPNALSMLKSTLQWRVKFGIEKLLEEDLGDDLEKVVFTHGHDREGHPVCYNVYGEFQNKELYAKTFGDEEKRGRFLRWRIQFLERSIRKLDFRPGGVNTIFQVNDLKNAPGPGKKELRQATRQALHLLQDNYPEFVAKQVFINLPWWYVAFYTMMSPFMTQRTKSKFVFTGPAKTAETLFKYISPEQVPIQYGGLSVDFCDCNPEFTVDDPATEIHVKPTTKQFVEILVSEKCVILWELRVIGWDVTYSAEFVPKANDKYTVIIQKATKMTSTDDPVVSGSFTITDLGKIVLTVDNPTFKRRKLVYRYKVLPYQES